MSIDPNNVDLDNIEDVTDIRPAPNAAVSDTDHQFHGLGHEGKRLLLELLEATSDDEPFATRVFDRLGVDFSHAEWNGYDLYWADGGGESLVDALERWNQVHSM